MSTPPPTSTTSTSALKVIVSFNDQYSMWPIVEPLLASRLPLRDVRWSASLPSGGASIDLHCPVLRALHFAQDYTAPRAAQALQTYWPEEPYVHVMLVACSGQREYDGGVSAALKAWLAQRSEHDEWLILYVSRPGDAARKAVTFFNVFSQMRKDFGGGAPERVLQLKTYDDKERADDEGWTALLAKLQEAIETRGARVMERCLSEMRKLDSERSVPGWNYLRFFAVKEGLALLYETFGLEDEALMQYDELEAVLGAASDALKLIPFGGCDPGDSSGAIFSSRRKDYRGRLLDGSLTVFDLSHYLYARQAKLLFARDMALVVAERGLRLVDTIGRQLEAKNFSLAFRLVWRFGALVELAESCKNQQEDSSKKDKRQIAALLGDIYASASAVLERLGFLRGLLPVSMHFELSERPHRAFVPQLKADWQSYQSTSDTVMTSFDVGIASLRVALELSASSSEPSASLASESFDKLCVAVRKKAMRSYREAHRPRAVAAQQFHVADLHFVRDRKEQCAKILRKVLKSHAPSSSSSSSSASPPASPSTSPASSSNASSGSFSSASSSAPSVAFHVLLAAVHARLCACLRPLLPASAREYVASLLALLQHAPSAPHTPHILAEVARIAQSSGDSEGSESLYVEALAALVRVTVARESAALSLDERASVRVTAALTTSCALPCAVDELCAQFVCEEDLRAPSSSAAPRTLVCAFASPPLSAASARLALSGEAMAVGVYVLDRLWVRIGRLVLTQAIAPEDALPTLTVRASEASARVDVLVGSVLVRGAAQSLEVQVHANRDALHDAELRLSWFIADRQHALQLALSSTCTDIDVATAVDDARGQLTCPLERMEDEAHGGVLVRLPRTEPRAVLSLRLPVHVPSAASAHNAYARAGAYHAHHAQELAVELRYSKHSGERFTVRTALDLHFKQPFHLDLTLLPLDAATTSAEGVPVFARLQVHNATAATVVLQSYALTVPRDWRVLKDLNRSALLAHVRADESLCLLFELEHTRNAPSTSSPSLTAPQCALRLGYSFAASPSESALQFEWPLRLSVPRIDYALSLAYAAHTFKGALSVAEWTVTLAPHVTLPHALNYSLHADERAWLASGKTRGSLRWSTERTATVKCSFVALKAGPLPLPVLRLEGVPPSRVNLAHSQEAAVTAYPAPTLTSACEKITVSDKKKSTLKFEAAAETKS